MSTQSQYRVTVAVDGSSLGTFDSRSGGEVDSDPASKQTGEGRKVYCTFNMPGDLTVSRGYERERDHELMRTLQVRAGRASMSVSEQPIDCDGNPWGTPKTWTGTLKTVNPGDVASDSNEPRELELVMVVKDIA